MVGILSENLFSPDQPDLEVRSNYGGRKLSDFEQYQHYRPCFWKRKMDRYFKGIWQSLAILVILTGMLTGILYTSIEAMMKADLALLVIPALFVYGIMGSLIHWLGVLSEEFKDYAHYRDFYLKSKMRLRG